MSFSSPFAQGIKSIQCGYYLFNNAGKIGIMTNDLHTKKQSSTRQPSSTSINKKSISQIAQALGQLLDASLTIPGTKIKVGLDPLIGLIPGIGDLISNGIGSSLLFLATKAGVPRIVILRMSMNIVINMVVGAIPIVGDLFSIWFKSNLQNAQILHKHSQTTAPVTTVVDWLYVGSIILGMILILSLVLSFIFWLGTSILAFFDSTNP